jgi:DNA-binding response OmpR family regulator
MNTWYTVPARILIADDDLDLLNMLEFAFRNAGFETVAVTNGTQALAAIEQQRFSLLVLDIDMPPPNGLAVCTAVREHSHIPVLMLSARDREDDQVRALEVGADAYLTKPFSPRILTTYVHALLRRASVHKALRTASSRFRVDTDELLLIHPEGAIGLTQLEARMLRILTLNAGKTLNATALIKEAWGKDSTANRNMVKRVVFCLRKKLAGIPDAGTALKTVRGGYTWMEGAAAPSATSTGIVV